MSICVLSVLHVWSGNKSLTFLSDINFPCLCQCYCSISSWLRDISIRAQVPDLSRPWALPTILSFPMFEGFHWVSNSFPCLSWHISNISDLNKRSVDLSTNIFATFFLLFRLFSISRRFCVSSFLLSFSHFFLKLSLSFSKLSRICFECQFLKSLSFSLWDEIVICGESNGLCDVWWE